MDTKQSVVTVAVSEARARLREAQKELNWFLWSSELSYGFALTSQDLRLQDPECDINQALADVKSVAWYPNYKGAPKYRTKISTFKEQLLRNTTYMYRSVLISWYTYFEFFLEERVRPVVNHKKYWGPLTHSLNASCLTVSKYSIRPRTVVLADLIRLIRNQMVHARFEAIDDIEHDRVKQWRSDTISILRDDWHCTKPDAIVDAALEFVIKLAKKQKDSLRQGLPIELFYTLYGFSNIDKLSFEIEEALLPFGTLEAGRLTRSAQDVRRKDIIVMNGHS